jgi:Cu(I)/Ag(I) efflux system membrane fusion protein
MLARARLLHSKEDALLIPVSAALQTGKRALVYVKLDEQQPTFVGREVILGQRFGDQYQVLSGLAEGELVVSKGAFRLDSELQIRGLPSMMAPDGAAGDPHAAHAPAPTQQKDFRLAPAAEAALLAAYQQAYLALTEDDLAAWQQAMAAFQQQVTAIGWPTHLADSIQALKAGADNPPRVTGLTEARQQFYQHNVGLLRLAELGVLAAGWYQAYCPMAHSGEGAAWLQPQAELLNPYFGSDMLHCGEIQLQFTEQEPAHDSH